jgi:DNA-directed RNA polymerase specialized sigma24 family protein
MQPGRNAGIGDDRALAALAKHPPPAELAFLATTLGHLALLRLIEARGGTRVKVPVDPSGSALEVIIGHDAAKRLAAERGAETLKVPLAKPWRMRVYRAAGLSYTAIALALGVGESAVHKYIQLARMTKAPAFAGLDDED